MSDFFEKIKKGKEKVQKFGDEQRRARKATPLPIMMLNDALPLLVVVTFILLGCLGGWWHPGWLVFLIIPIYYMTAEAIIHKSWAKLFDILVPILTVGIYLVLGFVLKAWHPGWVVFFAIPLYYTWESTMHRYKAIRNGDEQDDDDDDDDEDDKPIFQIKFHDKDEQTHEGINPDSIDDDTKTPDDKI